MPVHHLCGRGDDPHAVDAGAAPHEVERGEVALECDVSRRHVRTEPRIEAPRKPEALDLRRDGGADGPLPVGTLRRGTEVERLDGEDLRDDRRREVLCELPDLRLSGRAALAEVLRRELRGIERRLDAQHVEQREVGDLPRVHAQVEEAACRRTYDGDVGKSHLRPVEPRILERVGEERLERRDRVARRDALFDVGGEVAQRRDGVVRMVEPPGEAVEREGRSGWNGLNGLRLGGRRRGLIPARLAQALDQALEQILLGIPLAHRTSFRASSDSHSIKEKGRTRRPLLRVFVRRC